MSNTGKFMDTAPFFPTAGKVTAVPDESTKVCVEPDLHLERPETPSSIKKYRKSFNQDPGVRVTHHGVADDSKHEDMTHGVPTTDGERVANVIAPARGISEIIAYLHEKKEQQYQSNVREPLGKSYSRNHALPGKTQDPNFAFGKSSGKVEPARECIYPPGDDEDEAHHSKYVKSHGNYHPGEQRSRNYQWDRAGVDPTHHRFGMTDQSGIPEGVAKALNPEKDPNIPVVSSVVSKKVEDLKRVKNDALGKSKRYGYGDLGVTEDHAFGMPTRKFMDDWGAKECMTGQYSEEEQHPDPNLGKSLKSGWRNDTTTQRSFGCPSIRQDIPPPRFKSVADNQNYGGEPNAAHLLYPSHFATTGVHEDDFLIARPKDEIIEIFKASGAAGGKSEEELEKAWELASSIKENGEVNLDMFRKALFQIELRNGY